MDGVSQAYLLPWGLRWLTPTRSAGARGFLARTENAGMGYLDEGTILLAQWQAENHRQLVNISRGVWVVGLLILLAVGSR